jgi:DNA-binding transcriptional LysR family regulator
LRRPRGVDLTDAGRVFLDDAVAILARLDRAFEATRRTARGEQGRVCLGVTPTSPFHPFVSQVVRTFRKTYPLVSITLEEWHSNDLIEHLRNERIDAALIRTAPADRKGLVISELMEEELVVVLPEGHPLARSNGGGGAALPLKALAGETFIIQGGQQGLSLYADSPRVDTQPGRSGPRHFDRPGLPPEDADRRGGVPSPQERDPTYRATDAGIATRRSIRSGSTLPRFGQASREGFFGESNLRCSKAENHSLP